MPAYGKQLEFDTYKVLEIRERSVRVETRCGDTGFLPLSQIDVNGKFERNKIVTIGVPQRLLLERGWA